MKAVLIRARRSNYDLGERETKYITWEGEILNHITDDTERAFCVIDINSLDELVGLIKEFNSNIIIEKYFPKYITHSCYGIVADYLIRIYDDYIE